MTEYRPRLPPVTPEGSFGISASETQKALEVDCFKELVNKLGWAVGSTYGRPYANRTNAARQIALALAMVVVAEHGWPHSIKK